MKRRRRQKETFFSLLYKSIRPYLSHSLSLLPLLLLFYIYAHTHAQNTRQKVCPSVHPEERVVLVRKRMFLQIRVKKMQKSFCSSSSFKIWSSLLSPCTEKKKISFLCSLVLEKKNLFGDEMNAPRSSLFTQHHHDGSLFFDSGSAREQSRFCKQGTIHERHYALCRLFFPRSFFYCCCFVRARASYGRVRVR